MNVSVRLVNRLDTSAKTFGNAYARRVVARVVDFLSARNLVHAVLQADNVSVVGIRNVEREHVVVD